MADKSKQRSSMKRKFCPACKWLIGDSEHYTVIRQEMSPSRRTHEGTYYHNGIWY